MRGSELRLEPIDKSNWRSALQVRTTPEQLEFVADYEPVALVILAKSYVRAGGFDWQPFAIKAQDVILGVVAIAIQEDRCEIYHLVIDYRQQGRGLGMKATNLVIEHIRTTWPQITKVSLTVHPRNEVAEHIYMSNGFSKTGEFADSEPVLELVF